MIVSEEELLEIEKQEKLLKDIQQMIGISENSTASYQTGFNYAIYKTAYIIDNKNKEIDRLNNIINKLEKYIVDEIDDAQEELNLILQGNDLDYKNECTKEFNCIKNALDMLLDKLKELKEGNK